RSGDQVASVLRGEAALAPRDSQRQTDADFYGGIWDSISGAAEDAWTLVSDPAEAAAGVVQAAAHPVDTAKVAVAHDDWTGGREPRALGRNTGDMILGAATLGAGKIASILGRETRIAGEPPEEPTADGAAPRLDSPTPSVAATREARTAAVRGVVLDGRGVPHGREDSKGVYMIDGRTLEGLRLRLHAELGDPESVRTPKGERETWKIGTDPRSYATYRTFSSSGGATIDVTGIDGLPVKRFHIEGGG
ncbi:MAG: hypothetical protein M3235_18495, partial [Actinomycetota bacterium]|nr:hypothetical protein [Actinomycetota bacterium]